MKESMRNDWNSIKLKFRVIGLRISRLTLDKIYPKDPNPEHWRTINGSKVHLTNGKIDGGAGGRFLGNTWTGNRTGGRGTSNPQKYIGPKTFPEAEGSNWKNVPSKEQMHKIGKISNALSHLKDEYIVPEHEQGRIRNRIKGMYSGVYSTRSGKALLDSLKKTLQKRNPSGSIPKNIDPESTTGKTGSVIISSEADLSKYLEENKKKREELRKQLASYGTMVGRNEGDDEEKVRVARKYNALYQQIQDLEKEIHTQQIKAAQKGIPATSSLTGKCGDRYIQDIQGHLKQAPSGFLTLWNAWEFQAQAHPKYKGRAYQCWFETYFDIDTDSRDRKGRKPYQTYFHEHGHFLDMRLSGYGSGHGRFYSTSYNNGEFIKAIHEDVDKLVKDTDRRLKAEFKERIASGDLKWFQDNGFISETDSWGTPVDKIPSWFKYRKGYAYQFIRKEIRNSDPTGKDMWSDLSDILQGATKDKIHCGWGHSKNYWNDPENLGTEAFAEFTSAHLSNKESLKLLNKYLPKASAVYLKMISDASAKEVKR